MKELNGKRLILTGAGGGIGRAAAEKLARCGMKLVLLGGNDQQKLEATANLVRKYTDCEILPGDLSNMEFLQNAASEAAGIFGGVDVLINNAGVTQNTPFEEVTFEEFDRIMTVNNKVPFFLTRALLPHLRRSAAASIINIASVVAHSGYPLQSVYSASKHALLGWSKSLARECYKDNIRVHAISPGGVYTDMVKISRPDLTAEGMIMPEEIADIIHFFLANRGNAVIDEIIVHRVNKEPFMV